MSYLSTESTDESSRSIERRIANLLFQRGVSTPVCYAESDYLISGWILGGDEYLAGRTAAVQAALGSGQVVLFAFSPHFRGQPRNTFKLLFNALVGSSTEGPPDGIGLGCR